MKIILPIVLLIFSLNAHAVRLWSSIAIEDTVFLAKNLEIRNTDLYFARSARFRVTDVSSLDMINVYLYKISAQGCPDPNASSDLELYTIAQRSGETTIGIELLKKCRLEIYVEKKDHKTRSLFN